MAEEATRPIPREPHEPSLRDEAEESAVENGNDDVIAAGESDEATEFQKLQDEFKKHMSTVPHPIAIITAHPSTAENDDKAVVGATVSSFNTVSFDPELVVSFNLTTNSATYRTILETKHFVVNFPTSNISGMALAQHFTKGNETPPLASDTEPAVGPVNFQELQGQSPPNMKQYPPGVKLRNKEEHMGEAGFAFAFLCEYQNSLPVADHVIVTGRLIPQKIRSSKRFGWGEHNTYGNSFSSHHITLGYVHRTYGVVDGSGTFSFGDLWKLDDRFRYADLDKVPDHQFFQMKARYENRLKEIESARLLQQDISGRSPPSPPKKAVLRASELTPDALDNLERHYKERLVTLQTWFESKNKLEESGQAESQDFLGWQNLLIRKKMLLSLAELEKEERLYRARLRKLKAQKVQDSQNIGDGHSAEVQKAIDLRCHCEDNLEVILEAKRRKRSGQPQTGVQSLAVKFLNTRQITRFLESKRGLGYEALKKNYRKDCYVIQEARLSLMEQENAQPRDEVIIDGLKARIAYHVETNELLKSLMVERITNADPSELNRLIAAPPEMKPGGKGFLKRMRDIEDKPHSTARVRDKEGKLGYKPSYSWKPDADGQRDSDTARDLEEMHAAQISDRHVSGGDQRSDFGEAEHDPLVMKHYEGEEIPSWPTEEKEPARNSIARRVSGRK